MPDATNLRVFAFGINEIDGCQCPATVALVDPGTTIAGLYDRYCADRAKGVVGELVARAAWLAAVKSEAQHHYVALDAAGRSILKGFPGVDPYVGSSVRVAKALGWLGKAWETRLKGRFA